MAGAPFVLGRPELGLWALVAPEAGAAGRADATALLRDLAGLDPPAAQSDLARLLRRRIEQEALRAGHRLRSHGRADGLAIMVALVRPPHLLSLRLGGCGLYGFGPGGAAAIPFDPPEDGPTGSGPRVQTLRTRLKAGERLILASPGLEAVLRDRGAGTVLAGLPPDAAARFLVQRAAAAGRPDDAAIVLSLPPLVEAAEEPPASRPMPAPPPEPLSRSTLPPAVPPVAADRASPALIAGVAALTLITATVVGLILLRPPAAPQPEERIETAPAIPDATISALDLSPGDLAAADRRLAQTVRLAVAVTALDRALAAMELPATPGAAPAQPFAPAALDARAKILAGRLPGLPLSTPLRGDYRLSSPFGYRVHPITGLSLLHAGLDMAAPMGTPIFATGNGKVVRAGLAGGYGNLVEIQHADGLVTRYAHMLSIAVNAGEEVTAATVVGTLGSTGASTGPHLHYEVRRGETPVDPMPFLEAGQTLKAILAAAIRR
ncbi:M23 family metallopeptidase [Inquilinus limosus]